MKKANLIAVISVPKILRFKRLKVEPLPKGLEEFKEAVRSRMPERHLLDVLKHAHYWVNYTRHFTPPSGSDPKMPDVPLRYLFTVFGYVRFAHRRLALRWAYGTAEVMVALPTTTSLTPTLFSHFIACGVWLARAIARAKRCISLMG